MTKDLFSLPLLFLLIAVNFFYFISCAYSTNSNDGSSLAAVMSLVKHGSYVIDDYVELTYNTDLTRYKEHYYTDRAPGTATLSAPFFIMGIYVGKNLFTTDIKEPVVFTLFVPLIMGTLSVFLLFFCSRLLGFSYWPSLIGSFFYAFGTLVWQKSTLLYTHIPALFILFFAATILLTLKNQQLRIRRLLGVGFLCGISSFFEYNAVIPGFVITLYSFYLIAQEKKEKKYILILFYCISGLLGTLPVLIYNYYYFDSPFTTSYAHKLHFTFYESGIGSAFSGSFIEGLKSYFLRFDRWQYIRNETAGILVLSPIFLFSFPGFITLYKTKKDEAIFLFLLFFFPVFLLAFHPTPLVRYITPYLPFFFLAGVASLNSLWEKKTILNKFFILFYCGLGVCSIMQIFYNTNRFYGHSPAVPFIFFTNELRSWFLFCLPFTIVAYLLLVFFLRRGLRIRGSAN